MPPPPTPRTSLGDLSLSVSPGHRDRLGPTVPTPDDSDPGPLPTVPYLRGGLEVRDKTWGTPGRMWTPVVGPSVSVSVLSAPHGRRGSVSGASPLVRSRAPTSSVAPWEAGPGVNPPPTVVPHNFGVVLPPTGSGTPRSVGHSELPDSHPHVRCNDSLSTPDPGSPKGAVLRRRRGNGPWVLQITRTAGVTGVG